MWNSWGLLRGFGAVQAGKAELVELALKKSKITLEKKQTLLASAAELHQKMKAFIPHDLLILTMDYREGKI